MNCSPARQTMPVPSQLASVALWMMGPPVVKVDTVIGSGDTHAIIAAAGARAMKIEEVVRASVVVQPGIPQASHDLRFENHVLFSQCKLRWPVRDRVRGAGGERPKQATSPILSGPFPSTFDVEPTQENKEDDQRH